MKRKDYGTATHEEVISGMETANEIARLIKAVPNPAVRNMIKEMIAQIHVPAPESGDVK